jgi:hypothetical protein
VNPYLILGISAAWLASLVGVGYWQNTTGHTAEKAAWQARENTELTAANAKILSLEEARRAEEQLHAQQVADISTKFEKEKADAAAQKARDIAAARAGRLVLRVPAACESTGGGDSGKAAAGAGEHNGGATTELPRTITANLFELADDCDAVARQLGAAQGVIRSDRAPPP